jgi:hypothetical protein
MDEFRLQTSLAKANQQKYPGISETPVSLGKRVREPQYDQLLGYT